MTTTFNLPGTIITGAGASQELPAQIRRLGAMRVLLVTDRFLEQQGLAGQFAGLIERAGLAATIFAGVQPDPTDENVRAGLTVLRASGAEAVVALGGGSAIDAAKAIAIMATNVEPLHQYMGYHKIPRAGLPLIAIPTTAGTGSEVTKVAVITDTARDVKMMLLDGHLLPAVALVDYELSMSMPPALTAHVGVDTLTHGIEAYVSRKANGMADPFARSCIALCAQHLYTAWSAGDDRAAREGMALAACHGGAAFANSSVCLVHGMSRPLGAVFHLPHGLSNAVLLPTVTRFSLGGALERYAEIARMMGYAERGASSEAAAEALASGLAALNERLAIPRLRDCHQMDSARFAAALEKMANDALASGSPQNNPVVPSAEQIVALYREAW
ncbi:MAG: iron-containing alcohol dehydrogenase [Chloroflexales bacterium]|nr:iron-containing alcohol dehydrogenase [Chloroflexales bacterium]